MKRPLVLAYAQDAGGARAILPVIHRLLEGTAFSVQTVAHGPAVRLFGGSRIPAVPLDSFGHPVPLSPRDAMSLLKRLSPDLFFSGTSHPRDPSNGRLTAAARQAGIPTVAILDHWKGRDRFRETPGGPHLFAPERLGVMDQATRAAYVADGIAPDRVEVVGHPYLEELSRHRISWAEPARTAELKRRAGLDPADPVILFASEIVHDHGYHDSCRNTCLPLPRMPVGQGLVLARVQEAVRDLSTEIGCAIDLVVRPHPNERGSEPSGVRVINQESLSDSESVAMALVVLGLSAMPLFEAAVLGKPVASLACFDGWDPSRVFFDQAVWDAQPFFPVLESGDQLVPFLRAALNGRGERTLPSACSKELLDGATDRCIELVKSRLGVEAR